MDESKEKNDRLGVWIAILIALISLTTALAAWRTAGLGSSAGDLIYQGLLNAVKRQASANEDWRRAYQEAGYARDYMITLNGLLVQENSTIPATKEQAAQLRTYLLPGMESMATPLGTDPSYLTSSGLLNIQKRFDDLEKQSPDLSSLDPVASFSKADTYYSEQRWLVVGTILIAVSLFWLGLSQLSHLRSRVLILALGLIVYGFGLVWCVGVEVVFFVLRGGGL
jgi:membrane protein YdbS with pleckstrin-like domain